MKVPAILLASSSSIRKKILLEAGYTVEQQSPPPEAEPAPRPGETPADYVFRAACEKGRRVAEVRDDLPVVSADQVVELDGGILRKVDGKDEAAQRLQLLSGRSHWLTGAWALFQHGNFLDGGCVRVEVTLFPLTLNEIHAYLEEDKPYSSVSCYYLEGGGIRLVEELKGCWFAALGLPLMAIQKSLRKHLQSS